MAAQDLPTLVSFFKALADESRLRIVGVLANRNCSVEELAELVQLKGPTVSHHLAKLKELELVVMKPEGNTHLYSLNSDALHRLSKDLLTPEAIGSLVEDPKSDAWERKVLRDFLVEGVRLKEIPASRKKRHVVLRWLATQFEPGVRYPESQVNETILRHHGDFATLRRELIGAQLMERKQGIYWRTEPCL